MDGPDIFFISHVVLAIKLYPAFLFVAIGWLSPNPTYFAFHIPTLCMEYKVVPPKVEVGLQT